MHKLIALKTVSALKVQRLWIHWRCPLIGLILGLLGASSQAQNTLNVADFGARGDAMQVWVNTTSNSATINCSNNIFANTDVGKTVELFGVGNVNIGKNQNGTNVTNCQDFIGIITNYVNPNNVMVSSVIGELPQATSNGVYCIYGTQNAPAFQAAVNASNGTNTIINIPSGMFLLIPPQEYSNYVYNANVNINLDAGVLLRKGGLHFVGAGRDSTILMADGAFKNQGGVCLRGMVFICQGPITNDFPLIWDSLTFDGGLQCGLSGNQGTQPANPITGIGWDGSSAAGLDSGSEPLNSLKIFENCKFQHFRGEMIKGITGSARNETILVTNCVFTDGNATAFNYNFAHTITGCNFSNMYQIEEFYLKYPTNAGSYFINNYATNIEHSFIALNGGTHTNMPYVIANNIFYQNGGNGIGTTPACNVSIVSNQFLCTGYSICIVIGEPGYQGYADNSNIVIAANNFVETAMLLELASGPPNNAEAVQVFSNSLTKTTGTTIIVQTYGWATNVHLFNNNFGQLGGGNVQFSSGAAKGQFALVDLNDSYFFFVNDGIGITNVIDYSRGSRFTTENTQPASVYVLQDSDASQIPPGAQILLDNSQNTRSYSIYLNSALTSGPIIVTNGSMVTFNWTNGSWRLPPVRPQPPTNLRVVPPASGG